MPQKKSSTCARSRAEKFTRARTGWPMARSGRGEQEGARARGGSRRVCAGAISSLRSGARLLHTRKHTPHRHPSLSLPRTRPRERRPRLPLLSELRESRRPPYSARPSLCAGSAGAREAGARAPIHLRTTARRARADESDLSPAGAARAPGEGRCHGRPANHLGAWQRPAAPARPAPSCQTVTLSVTVRSNDIRILKQLVIRGVISCN